MVDCIICPKGRCCKRHVFLLHRMASFFSGDTLQVSIFTRNCDTVISYLKNYYPLNSLHPLPKHEVN